MTKLSKEYGESILAEARANVQRLAELTPREAPVEFAEPLERYRDDALVTSLRRERETTKRALRELQETLVSQFEQRFADEISTMKDFLVEVCGQALGTYRETIVSNMENDYRATFDSLSAEVAKLRAAVHKLGGAGKDEPIDLPNPLPARRLQ